MRTTYAFGVKVDLASGKHFRYGPTDGPRVVATGTATKPENDAAIHVLLDQLILDSKALIPGIEAYSNLIKRYRWSTLPLGLDLLDEAKRH